MVSYWKTRESIEAKVYQAPEGHFEMKIPGEKYPFQGYPRGILLYGQLSKLKHEIKNQIFNEAWRLLEDGAPPADVLHYINYTAWPEIYKLAESMKYDMVPFERMNPPVKEIHRALTAIGMDSRVRDTICFIIQEDDAYRMRFQWLVKFFPRLRKPSLNDFVYALEMAEHAETVSDMKERQRLFRRIFLVMANGSDMFNKFLKEVNWKKVGLSKADKYYFRAKYFKVDYPEYQY